MQPAEGSLSKFCGQRPGKNGKSSQHVTNASAESAESQLPIMLATASVLDGPSLQPPRHGLLSRIVVLYSEGSESQSLGGEGSL